MFATENAAGSSYSTVTRSHTKNTDALSILGAVAEYVFPTCIFQLNKILICCEVRESHLYAQKNSNMFSSTGGYFLKCILPAALNFRMLCGAHVISNCYTELLKIIRMHYHL